jgi:dUTP pyrophosphatase
MRKNRGFEKVSFEQWDKDNEIVPESKDVWESVVLPERATSHSAGYDIYSPVDFILKPTEEIKIPLGWKVYMLQDEFFTVIPRSGLGFKYYLRLANTTGLIDHDYFNNEGNEGHCWIKLRNEGNVDVSIRSGDAIAQGIFQKYLLADADTFTGNKRSGGFGSTSK